MMTGYTPLPAGGVPEGGGAKQLQACRIPPGAGSNLLLLHFWGNHYAALIYPGPGRGAASLIRLLIQLQHIQCICTCRPSHKRMHQIRDIKPWRFSLQYLIGTPFAGSCCTKLSRPVLLYKTPFPHTDKHTRIHLWHVARARSQVLLGSDF